MNFSISFFNYKLKKILLIYSTKVKGFNEFFLKSSKNVDFLVSKIIFVIFISSVFFPFKLFLLNANFNLKFHLNVSNGKVVFTNIN